MRVWQWVLFLIFSDFCFHHTKCCGVLLRLATVTTGAFTDNVHFQEGY
jgi:hypothetical protein